MRCHLEMLISDFIVDETRNGLQTTDASCGEVHLEIDAYSHPSTGELDGSIRGKRQARSLGSCSTV